MVKNITVEIPDHEPLIKALREDIGLLAKKVKEIGNREIPIPKDYDPEFSRLNKELETIKSNVRTTIARLSTRIDDVNSKPAVVSKDYSGELVSLSNQLAKVNNAVRTLESKKSDTEPLKQDIKGIKASIDDLYKSINRVIDAVNNFSGKGGGRSTYVLEQNGTSSTAAVNKTDYTAKGDIMSASAAGSTVIVPVAGTAGYVISADSAEVAGWKWAASPAGTPADTTVALTAYGAASAAGTSTEYSRGDHSHGSVADLVSGTAHATLNTGVHGAGTSTIATAADIATHAALTSVHSLGSAASAASTYFATATSLGTASTAASTYFATATSLGTASTAASADFALTTTFAAHTASATTHGAGTIAGLADITTHAALTSVHSLGSASTAASTYFTSTANFAAHTASATTHGAGTIAGIADITTHAALTSVHSLGSASTAGSTYFATTAAALPKQLVENDPLMLDPALSATGQYSGVVISGTSNAALAFGQVVYQAAGSARWGLAAATAASGVQELGICVLAATGSGTTTTVLLYGNVCAAALTACALASAGSAIFISATAGSAVIAAPAAGSAIVRVIGHSLAASTLTFRPDGVWLELA